MSNVDHSSPVRRGEELPIEPLVDYLSSHLPELSGSVVVEQFPAGFSNLTYLLRFADRELVLRRPPIGAKIKTAHDMGREYRILSRTCIRSTKKFRGHFCFAKMNRYSVRRST